jgi:hypothetical protein
MRRSKADETPSNQTVGYVYTRHETMPKDTPALELTAIVVFAPLLWTEIHWW